MAISAIFTAIGGVISAVGAIQSANAQAAASEYDAQISERNRVIADQNRKHNVELALIDAEDKRRDNARNMSTIRAAYGGSGLDLAGSPLDVLEDTALEQELDVRRTEYEGRVKNREGGMQMQEFKEKATLSRMEAKNAKKAGILSAFGYLANAGASLTKGMSGVEA